MLLSWCLTLYGGYHVLVCSNIVRECKVEPDCARSNFVIVRGSGDLLLNHCIIDS